MGQYEKFDDLPPELKSEKALKIVHDKSVNLTYLFGTLSAVGWGTTVAISKDPDLMASKGMYTASFGSACISTTATLIGVLAIRKLKKFVAEARSRESQPKP